MPRVDYTIGSYIAYTIVYSITFAKTQEQNSIFLLNQMRSFLGLIASWGLDSEVHLPMIRIR